MVLSHSKTPGVPVHSYDAAAIEAELRPQSTTKLRTLFIECYGKAAEFILRAAIIVKLLEERGEELRGMPGLRRLRRIASGQILPEIAWTFVESPGRQIVEGLPIPDQKRLAENPVVPVVEPAVGGGFTTRLFDLTTAPKEIVQQAIGPEGQRSETDQIGYLNTERRRQTPVPPKEQEPDGEPRLRSITVKLTESEWEEIRIEAARARIKEAEMAHRIIVRGMKRGKQ